MAGDPRVHWPSECVVVTISKSFQKATYVAFLRSYHLKHMVPVSDTETALSRWSNTVIIKQFSN